MASGHWKLVILLLVIVQIAHQAPLDPKPAEEETVDQTEPKPKEGGADEVSFL